MELPTCRSSEGVTKFHLLPKGEGWDEGERNSINPQGCDSARNRSQALRKKNQSLLTSAPTFKRFRNRGMTLVEVLAVLAAVAILVVMYIPRRPTQMRIQCVNNLKQVGLAARVWEGDHNDKFPMAESETNGGTMEYITGPEVWRHFQVMSNELSTPKVVICPAETDRPRFTATNFTSFNNSNLSFFLGVDANEALPRAILSGDHNLTNGLPPNNAVLPLTTNRVSGWTSEMHRWYGNLCLADGSVLHASNSALPAIVASTGLATNRIQKPILKP
jgi:prepilin-type N-terminal cleavage/methylation domain-containing protein